MSIFLSAKLRGFLCAGLLVGLAQGQETLSALQRELDRVERETEREKELHKADRARASEFEKRKTEKLQALRNQMRSNDVAIDSLKREMETQRRRKAGQKSQSNFYGAKQKEFRQALAKEITAMIVWVEKDFPYQKEKRLSEWNELAKVNQEGVLPPEEIVSRFFTLIQVSQDFGQDTEVYPGTYKANDGSQWEGLYVRLGAVLLAFASNDGKTSAYLTHADTAYVWRDQNLTEEAKSGIQTAIQVAQGKLAPQLVPLPLEAPKAKVVAQ